jgi:hypothetical protein
MASSPKKTMFKLPRLKTKEELLKVGSCVFLPVLPSHALMIVIYNSMIPTYFLLLEARSRMLALLTSSSNCNAQCVGEHDAAS